MNLGSERSDAVILEDETLRDGLQNVGRPISLQDKTGLFASLVKAGLRRIQVGSFVHPRVMPQMADTDRLALAAAPGWQRKCPG